MAIQEIERTCLNCEESFSVSPWEMKFNSCTFCNQDCYNVYRHRPEVIEARFWSKVDKTPGQGPWGNCWVWIGWTNEHGYGGFHSLQQMLAHRFAYELCHGPLSDREGALHRCDFPPCVRPDHLFAGTQVENMADCAIKGRTSGHLTVDDVLKIRSQNAGGVPKAQIARAFGVGATQIGRIVNRTTWKHI